jgi:hypothetical protein
VVSVCRASVTSLSVVRDICTDRPWHLCRVSVISGPSVSDISVGCPLYLRQASVTTLSGVRDICVERPWYMRRVSVISAPSFRDIFIGCPGYLCRTSVPSLSSVRAIFFFFCVFAEQLQNSVQTFFLIFQVFIVMLSCNIFYRSPVIYSLYSSFVIQHLATAMRNSFMLSPSLSFITLLTPDIPTHTQVSGMLHWTLQTQAHKLQKFRIRNLEFWWLWLPRNLVDFRHMSYHYHNPW